MGAPNVVPNPGPKAVEPPVKTGGESKPTASVMGIPLTRWAMVAVSVIFVAYVAITYGMKVYQQGIAIHDGESDYSKTVTEEMEVHRSDRSGQRILLHHDTDGDVWAVYFSDGCIELGRPGDPLPYVENSNVEWSLTPARRPHIKAPVLPTSSPVMGRPTPENHGALIGGDAGEGILQAGLLDSDVMTALHPVQAGCMNPHPWPFRGWWGQPNGCWVPFWRQWNDGCTHYEMYNTCSGQWDPQIFWTFCSGQHHQ